MCFLFICLRTLTLSITQLNYKFVTLLIAQGRWSFLDIVTSVPHSESLFNEFVTNRQTLLCFYYISIDH